MAYSLNKVQLIGNLTRDPELKYTPSGSAVCNFGIATNRQWTTEQGEKQEAVEFHNIVAWNKLAEICGQFLQKGKKVYVEGRLQTRKWTGQDEVERRTTEVVITDMIMLDSRGSAGGSGQSADDFDVPDDIPDEFEEIIDNDSNSGESGGSKSAGKNDSKGKSKSKTSKTSDDSDEDDDIPF